MDKFTIKNLELLYPSNENGTSLLDVIDYTCTPMGARMIKKWLLFPLKNEKDIKIRLDIVDTFYKQSSVLKDTLEILKSIGDIDRMIGKISTLRISPRELNKFKESLIASSELQKLLSQKKSTSKIHDLFKDSYSFGELINNLNLHLNEDAPVLLSKGNVIKEGISEELDMYRELALSSERILDDIRDREIERTGISSLKISYNNVFGYYLEVRNTH